VEQGPRRTKLLGLPLGHAIEEQRVDVTVASEDAAFALIERIGELNRARFLPMIERIFDEFDRPGERIRIDRIDLDLGRFDPSDLGAAEARLGDALREALRKAMPAWKPSGGDAEAETGAGATGLGEGFVELLEHYLLHGVWPYGSGLDLAAGPADLLAALIADRPQALAAMLRRHGRSEPVLTRLVRQMPAETLARLLHLIEPRDAAWILAYMAETRAGHAAEPLIDETSDAFERLLWTIVLRDALNRPGLHANRRAFLSNLIAGIAEAGTASLADLLAQIRRGLVAVHPEGSPPGSLLALIDELSEAVAGDVQARPDFASVVALLEGGWAKAGALPQSGPAALQRRRGRIAGSRAAAPAEVARVAETLRAYPVAMRLLLRRLMAEDGDGLIERLDGVLSAQEIALFLLPAGPTAPQPASAEAGAEDAGWAGGPEAGEARSPKPNEAGTRTGVPNGRPAVDPAPIGAAPAGISNGAAPSDRAGPDSAAGVAPAAPLARLEQLLEHGVGGEPELWAMAVQGAIADAMADDRIGTRRAMRRLALADAAELIRRAGGGRGAGAVLRLLLPAHSSGDYGGLIEAAGCSPAEAAGLVRLAASVPASATPQRLARHALAALASARGIDVEALRADLLGRVRRSGGSAGRALARLIEAAGVRSDAAADAPAARRAGALDALRAALAAPGTGAEAPKLSSLAGISRTMLREHLGAGSLDRNAAASVLRRLGSASLLRLALLLAPRGSAARAALRRRLAVSSAADALARIAAELLVAGTLAEQDAADPFEPPSEAVAGGDLAFVRRALRRGGAALAAANVRRAVAISIEREPIRLVALLASAGGGPAALRPLLADRGLLAVFFAGLGPDERRVAAALAALLGGPEGRSAIGPEKTARALVGAAAHMLGRAGATGLAARWLDDLMRASSLSERAALLRLLAGRWPDDPGHALDRAALGLAGRAARDMGVRGKPPARGRRLAKRDPDAPPPAEREKGSAAWLIRLLQDRPAGFERRIGVFLRSPAGRLRLVRTAPEALLLRLLGIVGGGDAGVLLRAGELAAIALEGSGGGLSRAAMWDLVLETAASDGGFDRLLALLPARARQGLRLPPDRRAVERIERRLASLARAKGLASLHDALDERAYDRQQAESWRRSRPVREERKVWDDKTPEPGLRIAIGNAGLVLANPFLPQFFKRLDLLAPRDSHLAKWRSPAARDRAVHLLQYLVDGQCDRPEPVLALNKLLCGAPLGHPTLAAIEPSEEEMATCRSLLDAIVAGWPMLKGSSVAALQETFLRRGGRIERIEAGWRVDVERKVLDVLVDNVPWSFSMILHPWMREPISVAW
jgi:hypothetical protein